MRQARAAAETERMRLEEAEARRQQEQREAAAAERERARLDEEEARRQQEAVEAQVAADAALARRLRVEAVRT